MVLIVPAVALADDLDPSGVSDGADAFVAPASPSDALVDIDDDFLEDKINEFSYDYLSLSFLRSLHMLFSDSDSLDLGEEWDVIPYEGEDEFLDSFDDPGDRAVSYSDDVSNVIAYDVTINNSDYVLYLPPDYVDNLFIDSQGRLWNVGTNSISGRLFTGNFNATATSGYLVTLGPCLGNTFSANRNYGSPNYMRHYYWSGNSLNYNTTYIVIKVNKSRYPFRVSDTLGYVIIILLGGALICLWKRSAR